VILDPQQAAKRLKGIFKAGKAFTFDYETNRLKPDHPDSEIVCCSVSNGDETISYPWVGAAITATYKLLSSSLPKLGANIKFEARWTLAILDLKIRNWKWDSMISAHHLDCRRNITSVKFQALVRLGQDNWSKDISPFLESSDANGFNRIREVDMRKLLMYCGLDALLEYLLCQLQRKEMLGK